MKKWMAMAAALALVGAAVPHGFAENVYTPGNVRGAGQGLWRRGQRERDL